MATSSAATVEDYLAELPAERRAVVAAVREVILKRLPPGYREGMSYGMISYEVPLERFPKTYNGKPLSYAALSAQKNHFAVYLTCVYASPEREAALRAAFAAAGKKLDMGKACVRFRTLDDLPLDAIGDAVAAVPVEAFLAHYEAVKRK